MKSHLTIIFTFLCFIFLSHHAEAQRPSGKVEGKIIDAEAGTPLDYATISIFSKKDSSLVTGGITDESGMFSIETPFGFYYAKIEFIAYKNQIIEAIQVNKDSPTVNLGEIKLEVNSLALEEVEVRAEKSQVQMSLDKRIFNVGKDLANNGGSAADVLDNVPSVTVDIDGVVSLRGNENVQILIDGKPSGMVGIGDAGGLRQLPSNLIDKVEVITNPSAKYEAEGTTGIINIVLRKEKKSGINGSFDFTVGTPDNYGAAINLNFRKNKLNLFTNFGISYRKSPGNGNYYQEVFGDTTEITEQISKRSRGGLSNSIRFGADYNFNAKNILTTSFSYRIGDDNNFSQLEYRDYIFDLNNPVSKTIRTDEEGEDEKKLQYAMTYRKLFKGKGHELVTDLRLQNNTETETSKLVEEYLNPDGTPEGTNDLLQRSSNQERETRLVLKMDYSYPFSKEGKFEAGYQGSLRQIRNDFIVEENNDIEWVTLTDFTNDFKYDENIHGIYSTYGNKYNRFSFQAGARLEYTDVNTELLVEPVKKNPRNYYNFFPSVFFTYDLINDNAVQISYSKRIRRPRFWYLNPFFSFSDRRNFFGGNPDLDPELTDSYELSHIKYWDKGSLTSSVYYRHTTGVIERILFVNDDGTTRRRPENLSTSNSYGFEFTFSYSPQKWLRINGDANFFRNKTEGELNGIVYSSEGNTMRSRMTVRGTIKKKTDIQARLNYRAPRITTQGRTKSVSYLELGMSRDILKNKGTLTFNISDVFNNRRRRSSYEDAFFFREDDFQWRARSFKLSLNYRLNQKKKRGGRRGGGGFEGGGEEF